MRKIERDLLNAIVRTTREPSLTGAEYDMTPGGLGRVEMHDCKEIDRLFASDDFRKGWEQCHARVRDMLANVLTLSAPELKRWLRQETANARR